MDNKFDVVPMSDVDPRHAARSMGQGYTAVTLMPTTPAVSPQPHAAHAVKDHISWSLFNFLYCNAFCIGFAALRYSIKSRDCKNVNDLHGAKMHGERAKNYNIIALTICIIGTIAYLVLYFLKIIYLDGSLQTNANFKN